MSEFENAYDFPTSITRPAYHEWTAEDMQTETEQAFTRKRRSDTRGEEYYSPHMEGARHPDIMYESQPGFQIRGQPSLHGMFASANHLGFQQESLYETQTKSNGVMSARKSIEGQEALKEIQGLKLEMVQFRQEVLGLLKAFEERQMTGFHDILTCLQKFIPPVQS